MTSRVHLFANRSHSIGSRRSLIFVAVPFLLVAALLASCSDGIRDQNRSASTSDETSLLFSVVAPTLTVTGDGADFRISLPSSSPVSWFTDRPARNAGTMDAVGLVSLWGAEDFVDDPPNAALVVTVDGEQRQQVVELSDARVDGTSVSFAAVDIGDADDAQAGGRSATHEVVAGTYGASELFIDNASTPPCASSITTFTTDWCLVPANAAINFKVSAPANYCFAAQISKAQQTTVVTFFRQGSVTSFADTISPSATTDLVGYPSNSSWKFQNGVNATYFYFTFVEGGDCGSGW